MIVSLEFGARRAVGYYAAETQGSDDCATAVELDRYAAEKRARTFPSITAGRRRPLSPRLAPRLAEN